jgi:ADP-glucose pyrophosphorylase
MDGVEIGRRARLNRVIVDKRVVIPPGTVIGEDPDEDRRRFWVDESGIVVIPKRTDFDTLQGPLEPEGARAGALEKPDLTR